MDSTGVSRHRVRVWFGEHTIADYVAEPDLAQRYAVSMSRRFPGLRITSEPADPPTQHESADVPEDARLWPNTVHLGVQG